MTNQELDQLSINTIRTLSIDAVQQAKSGHPGTPMALALLIYTIWNRVLRFAQRTQFGPTAIGSCSPMVTRRCCSGLCCT
jgi:transketolase